LGIQKFHRRSIRLKEYDYSQTGAYFVTLVTVDRACLFGEVEAGVMRLNPFGSIVENEWRRLGERFERINLDEWVVMPNHLHGILLIVEEDVNRAGTGEMQGKATGAPPGSLGAIVGSYKSITTRMVNALRRTPGELVWQRNYYEHIIRNEDEWEAIRSYIRNNPPQWELDRENPYHDRVTE
jgi:putative transposase